MALNPWHLRFARALADANTFAPATLAAAWLPAAATASRRRSGREPVFARGPRFSLPDRRESGTRPHRARSASVGASVLAMLLASLSTACSMVPAADAPHGIPSYYGDARAPAASARVAQYGLGANATYRLCVDDCPAPTAKRWVSGTPFVALSPAPREATAPAPDTDHRATAGGTATAAATVVSHRIAQALSRELRRHAPAGAASAPAAQSVAPPSVGAPGPQSNARTRTDPPQALRDAGSRLAGGRDAQALLDRYAASSRLPERSPLRPWRATRGAPRIPNALMPHRDT
jgi:hypothetical protein